MLSPLAAVRTLHPDATDIRHYEFGRRWWVMVKFADQLPILYRVEGGKLVN